LILLSAGIYYFSTSTSLQLRNTTKIMDSSAIKLPVLKDLNIENITENVHAINSQCKDPRMRFLFERLVTHLHDFTREVRLSTAEWSSAIQFLTQVGQISSDVRQEFILLSDILGLSLLVDSIDHPKPPFSTEGTVLGPFHTHDANIANSGDLISQDQNGEPLFVLCTVKDTEGRPISGVKIDVWETDSNGFYDVQHGDRAGPDGRAIFHSDKNGMFFFKAVVPVSYPIPDDGPVGQLLKILHRHSNRPSHMHFMFDKPGYDHLITYVHNLFLCFHELLTTECRALYLRGDPYETSDAVFGVKESLVVDIQKVGDEEGLSAQYGISPSTSLLKYDFVLVSDEKTTQLREQEAKKAIEKMGWKMQIVNGLPVPDVD
jgi:protocatechuate 3,4-dioxygenase beta subunit